jgi:hypothetical protein
MPPSYDEPTVVLDVAVTQAQLAHDDVPTPEPNESDAPTVKMPALQWPAVRRQR